MSDRSPITRIFISSDEPRMRTGWRLLSHYLLYIIASTISLFVYVLIAGLSIFKDIEGLTIPTVFEALIMILVTWIARRFFDRRSFHSLGFQHDNHTLPDLILGFSLPCLMIGSIYIFEWTMGWLQFDGWAWNTFSQSDVLSSLFNMLITFTAVGLTEELQFRGYYLQNLTEGINLPWALFLSSTGFSVLHLLNPYASWTSFLGVLAAGYFMAYGWLRTGRLWLSIGLHIGWNFFEGAVFGFSVSGLEIPGLIHQSVSGPTLITGGAFGPEAGFISLPAIIIGALVIRFYTRERKLSITNRANLLQEPPSTNA